MSTTVVLCMKLFHDHNVEFSICDNMLVLTKLSLEFCIKSLQPAVKLET